MGALFRSSLAVAVGSLALAFAPNPAQALVATVNVGGTNYDVTFFTGAANSNLSKFETPANGGQMPWRGNSTLAKSFATAVDNKAGTPNLLGSWCPFFGFAYESGFPRIESWYLDDANVISSDFFSRTFASNSWATATLTPTPSAVPGPLPLFGAAAAFGVSRRLRRRIQLDG